MSTVVKKSRYYNKDMVPKCQRALLIHLEIYYLVYQLLKMRFGFAVLPDGFLGDINQIVLIDTSEIHKYIFVVKRHRTKRFKKVFGFQNLGDEISY